MWAGLFFCVHKKIFVDLSTKTSQNMRYFAGLFGDLTFYSYFCRRICDVNRCNMLHKVGMRYVYTRKRKLDRLPMGRF